MTSLQANVPLVTMRCGEIFQVGVKMLTRLMLMVRQVLSVPRFAPITQIAALLSGVPSTLDVISTRLVSLQKLPMQISDFVHKTSVLVKISLLTQYKK